MKKKLSLVSNTNIEAEFMVLLFSQTIYTTLSWFGRTKTSVMIDDHHHLNLGV